MIEDEAKNFGHFGVSFAVTANEKGEQFGRLLIHREAAQNIIDHLQGWLNDPKDTNRGYYINLESRKAPYHGK